MEDSNIDFKLSMLPRLDTRESGRLIKHVPFEVKVDADLKRICGYASTFGNWDSYNDIIRKGAFSRTIAEKHAGRDKSRIKFLWQHRYDQVLGLAIDLKEDSRGLYFEGEVIHPGELGLVALRLATEGAIDAFSIGFDLYPNGSRWLDLDDLTEAERKALLANNTLDDLYWMPPRELTAIDLWENSLVTWGANPQALVEGVRSMTRSLTPGWRPEQKSNPSPAPQPKAPVVPVVDPALVEGRVLHVHFSSVEEVLAFAKSFNPKADEVRVVAEGLAPKALDVAPVQSAPAPAPEAEPKSSEPAPEPKAAPHLTGLAEGIKALRKSFAK